MEYVFSDVILKQLELNPGYLCDRNMLRIWIKDRFRGSGLKNQNLTHALAGTPISEGFLRKILTYLHEEASGFAQERLEEDWSILSIDEICERHIRRVAPEFRAKPAKEDLIQRDPERLFTGLVLNKKEMKGVHPLHSQDIEVAAQTIVAAVGDYSNGDPDLMPFDEAIDAGLHVMGFTFDEAVTMVETWHTHCPNSIWIKKGRDRSKHLITQVLPISDAGYHDFINGQIDEIGIAYEATAEPSSKLFFGGVAGDVRHESNKVFGTVTRMAIKHFGSLAKPVSRYDTNVLTFLPEGTLGNRAKAIGFETVKGVAMERTGLPLAELILPRRIRPGIKTLMWAAIALAQGSRNLTGDA